MTNTTTTTPDLSTMTPVQIDTILAEIWGRISGVQDWIDQINKGVRMAKKCLRQRVSVSYSQKRIDEAPAKLAKLQAELEAIKAEAAPYEAEYARRPWTRAYLCTANNGHVHKNRACSTTRISTKFLWLIDYAGKDEAQIVADAGCIACTVCFPSAPVESLARPTRIFASPEAKAKAEKKAAAEAAKCAGSGTWDYPRETARLGYYTGNYGKCSHCNQNITVTSTGKMRQHKGK